ncbi:uncharacterized protein LOC111055503 isoform X2 [Nilaparvata lugens]|uniref:uncharacterized protein LOC111055503 isoform X2 n=1 Tax=Nilaparvata lugens TaxID=108931 RepID=UPI00193D43C1|nr:uncharacterized protein LOC111055503 isoform X2 [Nilaparvata lugens]
MSALVHAQNNTERTAVPSSLRVGTKVTRYSNCTVDPGPSRVVHCPDLNACLLNQQDPGIDCQAVHFGYAIPVRVVPIGGGGEEEQGVNRSSADDQLAQLVLDADSSDQLSKDTLAYLLQRHPQLKVNMTDAVTAVEGGGGGGGSDVGVVGGGQGGGGEEDIAAIAKQISDHAEAIYQTWKSRGLAPTEILNCHSGGGVNRFKPALTPTTNRHVNQSQPTNKGASQPGWIGSSYQNHTPSDQSTATANKGPTVTKSPVVELLASDQTNKLERLVSNFVSEDRARQAANSQTKTLPSSIQFALQKFERKAAGGNTGGLQLNRSTGNGANRPTPVAKQQFHNLATQQQPLHGLATQQQQKYSGGDTVEVIYPSEEKTSPGVVTNTWPLKNKIQDGGKRNSGGYAGGAARGETGPRSPSSHRHSSQAEFLDEVAKEEERLINALKTGMIIAAEEPQRRSKTSTPISPPSAGVDTVDSSSSIGTAFSNSAPNSSTKRHQVSSDVVNGTEFSNSATNSSVKRHQVGTDAVNSTAFSNSNSTAFSSSGGGSSVKRRQVALTSDNVIARSGGAGAPSLNPVRPFLTRGSVAERVLIFEKCPTELGLEKRVKPTVPSWKTTTPSDLQNAKLPNYSRDSTSPLVTGSGHHHQTPAQEKRAVSSFQQQTQVARQPHTTLQRHAKANRHQLLLPRFYFPHGKPTNQQQFEQSIDNIKKAFQTLPNCHATRHDFAIITKAAGCPLYWKAPLFIACGGEKLGHVEVNTFIDYWRSVCSTCHDDASRFMRVLSSRGGGGGGGAGGRSHLFPEDFMPLVQDVVDTHPGLTFLKEAAEFHSRYIHTVISRIYYCVNQSWSGQISLSELRRSDLLRVIELLESEEDINQVTQYFSYEHFYVIYCKFWELDRDHDLYIDKDDLARHSDHEFKAFLRRVTHPTPNRVLTSLSTRLIGRIFSGTVTRGGGGARGHALNGGKQGGGGGGEAKMSYTEFVWFLLAEEDKMHPRAIEYWFRCMDLDGDGYLSMYELEYFYDEQLQRMEAIGIECLPFEDCLCQMLDMIRPQVPGKISLADLKRCKMTPIFFDTFFNLEKYLDHEQRDPFASQRDHDTEESEVTEQMSDWDRYAAEEYELLVAEEGGNDNHDDIVFEGEEAENDDEDDDILSPNLDEILSSQTFLNNNNSSNGYLRKKRLKAGAGTTMLNEITGDTATSNGNGESNSWSQSQPFVTVTDFDNEDDSSSDYAADSDCSL